MRVASEDRESGGRVFHLAAVFHGHSLSHEDSETSWTERRGSEEQTPRADWILEPVDKPGLVPRLRPGISVAARRGRPGYAVHAAPLNSATISVAGSAQRSLSPGRIESRSWNA